GCAGNGCDRTCRVVSHPSLPERDVWPAREHRACQHPVAQRSASGYAHRRVSRHSAAPGPDLLYRLPAQRTDLADGAFGCQYLAAQPANCWKCVDTLKVQARPARCRQACLNLWELCYVFYLYRIRRRLDTHPASAHPGGNGLIDLAGGLASASGCESTSGSGEAPWRIHSFLIPAAPAAESDRPGG